MKSDSNKNLQLYYGHRVFTSLRSWVGSVHVGEGLCHQMDRQASEPHFKHLLMAQQTNFFLDGLQIRKLFVTLK